MNENDIIVNHTYESKKPKKTLYGLIDDRQVLWVGKQNFFDNFLSVQYDSPTISDGRKFPKTTMEKFLKWCGKDVTDQMPKGEWRTER